MTMEFEGGSPGIRVVGVGRAGENIMARLIESGISGVEFIGAYTDVCHKPQNPAPVRVRMGARFIVTGFGTGMNAALGRKAAEESEAALREALMDTDLLLVLAGMGGGTGSGAAPVIARIAKSLDSAPLLIAVVTFPFGAEIGVNKYFDIQAKEGIDELRRYADMLLIIPNDRLSQSTGIDFSDQEQFNRMVQDIPGRAISAITDVLTAPGSVINVKIPDIRKIMAGAGEARLGIGTGTGPDRAAIAARRAVSSPLLDGIPLRNAKGIFFNITGHNNFELAECHKALEIIQEAVSPGARISYGIVTDKSPGDEVQFTLIATGLPGR